MLLRIIKILDSAVLNCLLINIGELVIALSLISNLQDLVSFIHRIELAPLCNLLPRSNSSERRRRLRQLRSPRHTTFTKNAHLTHSRLVLFITIVADFSVSGPPRSFRLLLFSLLLPSLLLHDHGTATSIVFILFLDSVWQQLSPFYGV